MKRIIIPVVLLNIFHRRGCGRNLTGFIQPYNGDRPALPLARVDAAPF